jgi:hypothetical protein
MAALRLWIALLRVAGAAVAGLVLAHCSFQLSSLAPKSETAAPEHTGSIRTSGKDLAPLEAEPSEVDLAYARAVAADALARESKDASIPWQNPNTGAGGNITPLASSYTEGNLTCRDFLASYVRGQAEGWLQGEACRTEHGQWEVKSLLPFKRG